MNTQPWGQWRRVNGWGLKGSPALKAVTGTPQPCSRSTKSTKSTKSTESTKPVNQFTQIRSSRVGGVQGIRVKGRRRAGSEGILS